MNSDSPVKSLSDLRVQIFADGADKASILELYRQPHIKGFTTNPTLMRATGVTDYQGFALDLLATIQDRPVSFEVFADEEPEMEEQARHIAAWGSNVFVKVPVMNTKGVPTYDLIRYLSSEGIQLNVTALLSLDQVRSVCRALSANPQRSPSNNNANGHSTGSKQNNVSAYVSVFAGRIADTGRDPMPLMREAVAMVNDVGAQLMWASPRELLNVFQADEVGCHVITATTDILKKLSLIGKDLTAFSQETVQMFRRDALKSGYSLPTVSQEAPAISRR
jgi:transaldolase